MRNYFYPLLLLAFSFLWSSLSAQEIEPLNAPFYHGTDTLAFPNVGGLNTPQFSAVDFDNDGVDDLLVFDRAGRIALTFKNHGTPNQFDYHYAPEWMHRFPQDIRNWMLLRDYNCDGVMDIFCFNQPPGTAGGMAVWKGSYDATDSIRFTLEKPLLSYPNNGFTNIISALNMDVPGIDDIDGDGDIDILVFDFLGLNGQLIRNVSQERGFGCDSLIFERGHSCFGMFGETGQNNVIAMSSSVDTCAGNPWWGRSPRHAGSTLTMIDANGDNVMDLVMGDVSNNNLNYITMGMIADTFVANQQDPSFPNYDVPVDLVSFPSCFFLDMNNDGVKDMVAAVNSLEEATTDTVAWFYANTQSNSNMVFELQDDVFFTGEMVDVGRRSTPTVVDYNGDGLLDIVIGHAGPYVNVLDPNAETDGDLASLFLYENVGTATEPAFRLMDKDFLGLSSTSHQALAPAFGDLDGDGDPDLLVGYDEGQLLFLENTTTGGTVSFASPVGPFSSIDVGEESKPQLVDLDRDGDLDLLVGERNGNVNYFENTGTPQLASFSNAPTTLGLSGFDFGAFGGGFVAPHIAERDGQYEFFGGYQGEGIVHLGNIEGNILGSYDTLSLRFQGLQVGSNSTVATADFDDDGTLDFIFGNNRGGVALYRGLPEVLPFTQDAPSLSDISWRLYPNPTADRLNFELEAALEQEAQIRIFNGLGQLLREEILPAGSAQWRGNVAGWSSGFYLFQWASAGQVQSRSFIVR